ncbi:hypothetical protein NXX53_01635 [Bacteroides salyersiae]|nr:hypothetical protein [Bacteroides salyersiae]
MKNSYSLLLFLLSCIPFGSFASTTRKLQNIEYRVDTLSHVVIGPGTTQTTLMLEGPVKPACILYNHGHDRSECELEIDNGKG